MGFSIKDFWETTPYEFFTIIDGYIERMHHDYELAITQSYVTANLVRAKKMPELNKLLARKEPKKVMSDDQMKQIAMTLNKLYGGEVIENEYT